MKGMATIWGVLALLAGRLEAQVQVRLDEPGRGTYSELHEGLQRTGASADTVRRVLREARPAPLWRSVRQALAGRTQWNEGLLALTRLAELAEAGRRGVADSAAALARRLERGRVSAPPGLDARDLLEPLRAIAIAADRRRRGDAAVRAELLPRVPAGQYGLADAWNLGRMGGGTADSLILRFRRADTDGARVRWLTLVSFARDTSAIPFLAAVYAAPDSAGIPPRYGARASDGLAWIGTREAFQALREARARARARGSYADPALGRDGLDFLAYDSAAVVARTGQPIEAWLAELP